MELIISLFVGHFIGDFIFQNQKLATTKGKNIVSLLHHCAIYAITILIFIDLYNIYTDSTNIDITYKTFLYLFVPHFIVDFITSKISGYYYYNKIFYYNIKKPLQLGFFPTIGLDQLLHTIHLIILFYYIHIL